MPDRSDDEAICLLRQRDVRGFELAYQAYGSRVFAFLLRLSRRKDLAEDLLQHTFLRLAERGSALSPGSDLRAWLFTVARNAYLSHARSGRVTDHETQLEAVADRGVDQEARLLLGDVESALAALSVDDRELLLLIGVEQLDHATVSLMLKINPQALRQRLTRARSRLLAELAQRDARPPIPHRRKL